LLPCCSPGASPWPPPSGLEIRCASRPGRRAPIRLPLALCLLADLLFGHRRLPLGRHRATRDACTTPSPAFGARRAATQQEPVDGQHQCSLCPGSRAQSALAQRFSVPRAAVRRLVERALLGVRFTPDSDHYADIAHRHLSAESRLRALSPKRIGPTPKLPFATRAISAVRDAFADPAIPAPRMIVRQPTQRIPPEPTLLSSRSLYVYSKNGPRWWVRVAQARCRYP
jgi:hypothetical protein